MRLANGNRNSTLFGGGYNWDYESILVNQAPGYQVEFDSLPTDYLFEEEDCKLYMDQIGLPNYGLYVCLAEDGLDLLAGLCSPFSTFQLLRSLYLNIYC